MIRTLLTSTALVALLATGALAQDNATVPADSAATSQTAGPSDMLNKGYEIVDTDGLASKLIGFPVYSSSANGAEKFGEINDLVVNQDGEVSAVLIGVGGFLGVGEKNVAVDYGDLQWTTAEDNTERLVLETTKEALNAAPGVEMRDDNPTDTATVVPADNNTMATDQPADQTQTAQNSADNPAANASADNSMATPADQTAMAPATEDANGNGTDDQMETGSTNQAAAPADQAQPQAVQPFDPAVNQTLDVSTLTADDLKGTNVYGPDNQHIGTIGDFVLGEDGKAIDAVIIDFGGFLGIGTKPVAIAYDKLPFYVDQNGNRSLVLKLTREQMDAAPAFNKDTYASERDTQRIMVDGAAAS